MNAEFDMQGLLDDEQRREEENRGQRRTRRHRLTLVAGVVGAVVVLGTGGVLTAAAVSTLTEDPAIATTAATVDLPAPTSQAATSQAPTPSAVPTPAPAAEGAIPPTAAPAEASDTPLAGSEQPAPGGIGTILGYTVYDETSDLDLIPRPTPEFAEEWQLDHETSLMQSHLDAVCMAEKGFKAAYVLMWQTWEAEEPGRAMQVLDELDALNGSRDPAWMEAMYGPDDQPLGEDYDWRQAGCHGASVHATGMDDAN
ncbi:hypothetical protein [Agromyces sp. LHK192]|uniref:hypothetical protein n=1 Tax=Agromyces sp. LHK192 TaxID=2498704 RepID=UPI000FD8F07D|nr:hypothetical protein [Agromyces sp. LHK192]